ncbi:hypothetical protein [Pedobacter sp. D749]|uniref:hypothetical protein n=1 Tax=Pedobacter sp. D749 TaxID=2856523 RepID=UPI001C57EF66|nr:hypothetical protein [Pedobacter sp. D749]QXU42078.1 hypothetical protein KYH19_00295 [Pedobacter sp. D749]
MAKELKIPFDDDFFYEKYGMPRQKNYKQLKKAIWDSANALFEDKEEEEKADTPTPSKGKKAKTP